MSDEIKNYEFNTFSDESINLSDDVYSFTLEDINKVKEISPKILAFERKIGRE